MAGSKGNQNNFDLGSYFNEHHKGRELLDAKPINVNLNSLESRTKSKVEIPPGVSSCEKLDDGSYRIVAYGEILNIEIRDPKLAPKIIESTFKILDTYVKGGHEGDFYETESYLSRGQDHANILLNIDNRVGPFDTTFLSSKAFFEAFGFVGDRNNGVVQKYADFLNSIKGKYGRESSVYAKLRGLKSALVERLSPTGNGTYIAEKFPPKPETQTPQQPQKPPKPGQTKFASAN